MFIIIIIIIVCHHGLHKIGMYKKCNSFLAYIQCFTSAVLAHVPAVIEVELSNKAAAEQGDQELTI